MAGRTLVIVRDEAMLYEQRARSFGPGESVILVLDRRDPRPPGDETPMPPTGERRRRAKEIEARIARDGFVIVRAG